MDVLLTARVLVERESAAGQLRVQGSAYVGLGTWLIFSKGRMMARITADSGGPRYVGRPLLCESNAVRFGEAARYQYACGRISWSKLSRYGLVRRASSRT